MISLKKINRRRGKFILALLLFGINAGLPVGFADDEAKTSKDSQVWELKIQPVAERFRSLDEVFLILTVKNVGQETRRISLPYRDASRWYQWIEVYHKGNRLVSHADEDFLYLPGTLPPGEKLSSLVPLEKFYRKPPKEVGEGRCELLWRGTTLGFTEDAKASFEIDPTLKTPTNVFSMDYYLKDAESLPSNVIKERIWEEMIKNPSNPKWLGLLKILSPELIDPVSLIELARRSDDLGMRREAVRTLGKIGKNPEAESLLTAYLKAQEDEPLFELGVESLRQLRGETA